MGASLYNTVFTADNNRITQGLNLSAIPKVINLDTTDDEITIGLSIILQSLYFAGYRVASAGKIVTPKGSIVAEEDSNEMKFECGNLLNLAIKPLALSPPTRAGRFLQDCEPGCQPTCEEDMPVCTNSGNNISDCNNCG